MQDPRKSYTGLGIVLYDKFMSARKILDVVGYSIGRMIKFISPRFYYYFGGQN